MRLQLDKEEAKQLRMKLLLYRFRVLRGLEAVDSVLSVDSVNRLGASPLGFGNGRIVELFFPLVSVANKGREAILEYAKDMHRSRLEEEQTTIEAQLVQVLLACESGVEQGRIAIQKVSDKFNEGKTEREQWKPRTISYRLKKMGFKSCRMPSGNAFGKYWDTVLIERLKKRYPPIDTPKQSTESTASTELIETLMGPRSGDPCHICGKQPGRLHLIPGEGEKVICDYCAKEYQGPL